MRRLLSRHVIVVVSILIALTFSVTYAQESAPGAPENVDLQRVIGRVGDTEITVGDFAARVRYEALRYYYALNTLADKYGENVVLLDDPTNQFAAKIQQDLLTLASNDFAGQLYDFMILEHLYTQEAEARGIMLSDCQMDTAWARQFNIEATGECEFPETLAEQKAEFFALMERYTSLSQDEAAFILASHELMTLAAEAVGKDFVVQDLEAIRTRQIRVADEETALELIERIQNGDDFRALVREYSTDSGAQGNAGELGTFERGQMVAEFEEAAFTANIGETVGPVQTQFGYHIIEVTDQEFPIQVRHILLSTEAEAYQVIRLLERGVDFSELVQQFSLDVASKQSDGSLGFVQRGQMVSEFEEAAFNAEPNAIVGPIQTQYGYHVLQVTDISDMPSSVTARHILLETEEEALAVLEKLADGEDFSELAVALSIDPSAAGHGGDTLSIITYNRSQGLYARDGVPQELEGVFEHEVGDIVGPIPVTNGYIILEVQEFGTVPPEASVIDQQRGAFVQQWELDQLASEYVEKTGYWRLYVPHDLLPSALFTLLEPLDAPAMEALAIQEADRENNTLLNVLGRLQVPVASPSEVDASN